MLHDINAQVDLIERTLQPRGRCRLCGGGEGYWKHQYGDPFTGCHAFQPMTPEPQPLPQLTLRFSRKDGNTTWLTTRTGPISIDKSAIRLSDGQAVAYIEHDGNNTYYRRPFETIWYDRLTIEAQEF
jgi:hypothetical protein